MNIYRQIQNDTDTQKDLCTHTHKQNPPLDAIINQWFHFAICKTNVNKSMPYLYATVLCQYLQIAIIHFSFDMGKRALDNICLGMQNNGQKIWNFARSIFHYFILMLTHLNVLQDSGIASLDQIKQESVTKIVWHTYIHFNTNVFLSKWKYSIDL